MVSQRRVCELLSVAESSCRYVSRRNDDELRERLVAAAREKPRWGYRRLQIVLEQSGAHVNHKRVYRVYREAGLMIHAGVFGIGSGHQFREPASDAGVGADCGGARSASGDSLRQRARVDVATFSGVVHGARDRACAEPSLTLAGLWRGASEGSKEKAPPSKTESGAPKILRAAAQAASPTCHSIRLPYLCKANHLTEQPWKFTPML